jgi:ribosomal protein L32
MPCSEENRAGVPGVLEIDRRRRFESDRRSGRARSADGWQSKEGSGETRLAHHFCDGSSHDDLALRDVRSQRHVRAFSVQHGPYRYAGPPAIVPWAPHDGGTLAT